MYKRPLVEQLKKRMGEERRFIQILIGPRQTGKTTALTQALNGIPGQYHFVSADDPSQVSPEWLRNEWEQARLIQRQTKKEMILAVDEIQKVPRWSSMVKLLWDEDTRLKIPLKVDPFRIIIIAHSEGTCRIPHGAFRGTLLPPLELR